MSLFLTTMTIAALWGVGNVLVKKGYSKLTPWQTYALDALFIALPLWVGYGLWKGINLASITPALIFITLFAGFTYGFYYYVINVAEMSLTASIIATYPITTLILAFLFLGERLELLAFLGILATIAGIILISCPLELKFKLEKWVILSLLVSLCYGLSGFIEKVALKNTDNATFVTVLAFAQIVIVGLWWLLTREPLPPLKIKNLGFSFWGILFINLGTIVFYIALEKGLASVVVPLSNTYITVVVLLSLVWLKEKITLWQIVGIISVILGVIFVGFNL